MFSSRVLGGFGSVPLQMALYEARVSGRTCVFPFLIKRDMDESSVWAPSESPAKTGFPDKPIDSFKA